MGNVVLPSTIEAYFQDKGSAAELFLPDGVVYDLGEDLELRGIEAIRNWLGNTSTKYKLTSEVRSIEERGGEQILSVVASGDFPGSPYEFEYRFKLEGDRIRELTIDPIGSLAG